LVWGHRYLPLLRIKVSLLTGMIVHRLGLQPV
jgi:hypothetical protein